MEVSGRKGATSMTDSISQSSTDDYDISCQPCSFEGNNVAAEGYCRTCSEYLCKTCLSVHRKQSVTRKHIILGNDQMPKVLPKNQDVCTRPCNVHVQEIVKFYCKSHDIVGCGDCMVLDHKTCKVDLVANVSSVTDDEKRELRKQIDQFEKEIEKSKQMIKSSEQGIADNYSKVRQDINAFREEINKSLDKMEAELVLEAKKADEEAQDIIFEVSKELQTLEMDLKQLSSETKGNTGGRSDLFILLKQGKSKMSYMKMSHTHLNNKGKIRLFEFERNDAVSKLFSGNASIGALKMLQSKPKESNQIPQHQTTMQENIMETESSYVGKIEIKDTSAKFEPKLSGIALLSVDELVVADNRQHNIRLINLQNNEIKNTLPLNAAPFDIARMDENCAAVTLPAKMLIKIISSSNGILTEQSDISVSGECYGICYYSDGFVVSFLRPGKVEMLDSGGSTIRSFVSDSSGKNLFSSPQYVGICQSSKYIYVSDSGKQEVIAITTDGKTIGVYKESIWPQGLFVLEDGKFLVLMYVGDISVISTECVKQKTMVAMKDNLKWVWAICYSYEHKKLFVSNGNGRYINVYQFK